MTENRSLAVGIDFGGTKMLGVVATRSGDIIAEHRLPTPYDSDELIDAVVLMTKKLEDDVGRQMLGVGIGAAGLVNREGELCFGPNVGGVRNVAVAALAAERLGDRRIVVDNDANCATWSECLFGSDKRRAEMSLITFGTGIGSGMVVHGRLVRGYSGFAAEYGHMTVVANGVSCICGKAGCWEAYASGRALARRGREGVEQGFLRGVEQATGCNPELIRGEHVTEAARAGDPYALEIMSEFAWWAAVGISNVIAIIDPEMVVIGGGLSEAHGLYIDECRRFVDEIVFGGRSRPTVPINIATMGESSGAIGAAMLVHGTPIPEV